MVCFVLVVLLLGSVFQLPHVCSGSEDELVVVAHSLHEDGSLELDELQSLHVAGSLELLDELDPQLAQA